MNENLLSLLFQGNYLKVAKLPTFNGNLTNACMESFILVDIMITRTVTFSYPEAALFLVSTRNCDLWEVQHWFKSTIHRLAIKSDKSDWLRN